MKKMKINNYILIIVGLLILVSCELEEANINPNDVTEVPTNVLLPFNQESLASLTVGTTQIMAGIFMQYYQGVENHPLPVQTYRVDEALYTEWNFQDYYNGPMINTKKMLDIAKEQGDLPYYEGIGKVLMAICLGNVSSLWGDIPYSGALNSSENLYPIYDSQQEIYENIQQLLDEAIVHFDSENTGLAPGSDDLIFNGDIEKWKKTAYALKARYYMHLSKRVADLSYNPIQEALNATQLALISNEDNMVYQYGYSAAEENPFYSYVRLDYLKPNNFFNILLLSLDDPRDSLFFTKKFGVADLGGRFFTSENSPVHITTFYEQKFIEAEARLRLNVNDAEIQNALNDAVYANMKSFSNGVIHDTIIDQYIIDNIILTGNFENDLETIIVQKYIAMYASIESWTDYRRTGYPVLTPNEGGDHNQNPGGAIPRRLPYCQTERLYNPNIPTPLPTLQDRFWWDQE